MSLPGFLPFSFQGWEGVGWEESVYVAQHLTGHFAAIIKIGMNFPPWAHHALCNFMTISSVNQLCPQFHFVNTAISVRVLRILTTSGLTLIATVTISEAN